MSNVYVFTPPPLPTEPEIVANLADLLDGARPRVDPSDDEACFDHLANLEPYRLSVVARHLNAAIYEYGQRLIAREMSRNAG